MALSTITFHNLDQNMEIHVLDKNSSWSAEEVQFCPFINIPTPHTHVKTNKLIIKKTNSPQSLSTFPLSLSLS